MIKNRIINIEQDRITEDASSIIFPAVILNIVRTLNGLKGCSNITVSLKDIGGGTSMLNGIYILMIIGFATRKGVECAYELHYRNKYVNMYENGNSLLDINESIMSEHISEELKIKVKKYISAYVDYKEKLTDEINT